MSHKRAELKGVAAHDRRIARVSSGAGYRRVIAKSLREGIRVVAQAQQAAVPKGLVSVRRALGSRVLKRSEGNRAKAGAGVGKKMTATTAKRSKPGVGISGRNIHWYVMGTKNRFTGTRSRRNRGRGRYREATGGSIHPTGRMPGHPFLKQAGDNAAGTARVIMGQSVREGLRALWNGGA